MRNWKPGEVWWLAQEEVRLESATLQSPAFLSQFPEFPGRPGGRWLITDPESSPESIKQSLRRCLLIPWETPSGSWGPERSSDQGIPHSPGPVQVPLSGLSGQGTDHLMGSRKAAWNRGGMGVGGRRGHSVSACVCIHMCACASMCVCICVSVCLCLCMQASMGWLATQPPVLGFLCESQEPAESHHTAGKWRWGCLAPDWKNQLSPGQELCEAVKHHNCPKLNYIHLYLSKFYSKHSKLISS